ncbi:hypothetical protein [Bradyrhizobium genosp. P]|uniref:hypothetical protein n=1 Tax=Bradyrhizobium genosp. P TaxID=83641 RepID=UPI003CF476BC
MSLFSSENWSGAGAASVAGILVVGASLGFAVVHYAEWSSAANLNQAEVAAVTSTPMPLNKRRTDCPQGKKVLPTVVSPLD